MTFGYTILYVADVERTVAFYEAAFGLARRFVHESGLYAEMETGQTALAFAGHALAASNFDGEYRRTEPGEPPPGFEIALVTDDVAGAFRRAAAAGAVALKAPAQKPWGQTVAYVRDADGAVVELASPIP